MGSGVGRFAPQLDSIEAVPSQQLRHAAMNASTVSRVQLADPRYELERATAHLGPPQPIRMKPG